MSDGVLYIAFGERYREEARRSIRSLRTVSPDLSIAVIAERDWNEAPVPDRFLVRDPVASFECKPVYMRESPFDRTLFLDTDTIVARDVRPMFGLLGWYDLAIRFLGPQLNEGEGLAFHAQCNSGVVLYRRAEAVERMFETWIRVYRSERERKLAPGGVGGDARGLHDQRSLSIAIAKSGVRAAHLETHLNFTLWQTIVAYSPPVVYHGRVPGIRAVDRRITAGWNPARDWHARLWLPNIQGLLPAGIRRSDPLLAAALVLRRAWNAGWRLFSRREREG